MPDGQALVRATAVTVSPLFAIQIVRRTFEIVRKHGQQIRHRMQAFAAGSIRSWWATIVHVQASACVPVRPNAEIRSFVATVIQRHREQGHPLEASDMLCENVWLYYIFACMCSIRAALPPAYLLLVASAHWCRQIIFFFWFVKYFQFGREERKKWWWTIKCRQCVCVCV